MKHTDIRAAVLDALEQHEHGATLFDGRPAVFDEADFPAIAVYLTGAEYTGEALDSDTWQAELHIEVFLPAQVPDSELDSWMESRIYPAMSAIPALSGLITTMVTQGYEYRRDDDMALWSSADSAQVPDSELDSWMESRIYPAMSAIPALSGLITTMVTQGYEYRRDDDMALWSSADLTYSITYEM
ncbi:phage minor tail U family protein [Escherichia coli]